MVRSGSPDRTILGDHQFQWAVDQTFQARLRLELSQNPESPPAMNNLAVLLATAPDPALRNGAEAVQLAERASSLSGSRNPVMLTTLAAAYAEAGRFSEAVASAQKAGELASIFKDDALLARNRELLELYRAGQPYHEATRQPQAE